MLCDGNCQAAACAELSAAACLPYRHLLKMAIVDSHFKGDTCRLQGVKQLAGIAVGIGT